MASRQTFKSAVMATPAVSSHYKRGLQGLRPVDRERISTQNPQRLSGSVNLDAAIDQPNNPVWDYGVGYRPSGAHSHHDDVYWVEVHPANSRHVNDVIAKLNWLKEWLKRDAPRLRLLGATFVWVASGAVALPPKSPKRRVIASYGIHFAGAHFRIPTP